MTEEQAIEVIGLLNDILDYQHEILVILTGYAHVLIPGVVFFVLAWWVIKQFFGGR